MNLIVTTSAIRTPGSRKPPAILANYFFFHPYQVVETGWGFMYQATQPNGMQHVLARSHFDNCIRPLAGYVMRWHDLPADKQPLQVVMLGPKADPHLCDLSVTYRAARRDRPQTIERGILAKLGEGFRREVQIIRAPDSQTALRMLRNRK